MAQQVGSYYVIIYNFISNYIICFVLGNIIFYKKDSHLDTRYMCGNIDMSVLNSEIQGHIIRVGIVRISYSLTYHSVN